MRKPKLREVTWHAQGYTAGGRHSWDLNSHLFVFRAQDPSSVICASRTIWLYTLQVYQSQELLKKSLIQQHPHSWGSVKGRACWKAAIQRENFILFFFFLRNSIRTLFYFLMRTIFKVFIEFVIMLFSFFCHAACKLSAPQPGTALGSWQWKPGILTTRPLENS